MKPESNGITFGISKESELEDALDAALDELCSSFDSDDSCDSLGEDYGEENGKKRNGSLTAKGRKDEKVRRITKQGGESGSPGGKEVNETICKLVDALAQQASLDIYNVVDVKRDSMYVKGGGFSGFWYTLGRLESIPSERRRWDFRYFCYSGGCLATVAALQNFTAQQVFDIASRVQSKWKTGEINRYQFVELFVDELLLPSTRGVLPKEGSEDDKTEEYDHHIPLDEDCLSRLNIITTTKSSESNLGAGPSVRQPPGIKSLRKMMIQSAWIPFATGNSLWLDNHMDGVFSSYGHPTCKHHIELPSLHDSDMLLNVLNFNLTYEKAREFYKKGVKRGF